MGQASWLKKSLVLQIQNTVFSSAHERNLSYFVFYLLIPDNMRAQLQDRITAEVRGDCQWENECSLDPYQVYLIGSVFGIYTLDLTLAKGFFCVVNTVQLFLHFSI